jgi:hypothetical protein
MNPKCLTTLCLLASLFLAHATAAQTASQGDNSGGDDAAREARAELERKALGVLGEVGEEAQGLKLAQNRVRLQVSAADLLWSRDEKRAREIFAAALAGVASVTGSIPADDPRREQLVQQAMNLRREIMQTISQHDPQLALDFLRATRPPTPTSAPVKNQYYQIDPELALEATLAEQVAARDPRQALRIADEVLAHGLSTQLGNVVERVRASDPNGAAQLATDIARKIRTANFAANYEVANLALYLLNASRPLDSNPARGGAPIAGRQPLALDEQARRDLLSTTINAALSSSNDARASGSTQYLLNSLQTYLPEIERSLPAQAQALRRRVADTAHATPNASQREFVNAGQAASVDAMIDIAAKAPPEAREQIYREAAWRAFNEGAPERARQIVNDHFEDSQARAQVLREFDQQLFWRAANNGDAEQARAILARFARPEEQLPLLLYLARALAGKGDADGARRLLDEVWNQIGGRAKSQSQFNMQLEAAQVYARFAPERAFEIVEAAIEQVNELIAAASIIDGFGQESFEQDELKTQNGYTWGSLINQCGELLAVLARTDFERALSTADRLQRLETRLPARLAVARGVLNPNSAPLTVQRRGVKSGSRVDY